MKAPVGSGDGRPTDFRSAFRRSVRLLAVAPIFIYQKIVSPMKPATCIYVPTCSAYAREAILRHGILKGLFLATARLLRCSGGPFTGGYDPVPRESSFRQVRDDYRRFRRRKGGA